MAKVASPLSVVELEQILEDRKLKAVELLRQREELQKQIDEIDRQLFEVMGDNRVIRKRRRRMKNDLS